MKKFILPLVFTAIFYSCNNDNSGETGDTNNELLADSLWDQVMEGHNVAMAKEKKLETLRQEAERLLDSINKLPAKAKDAAAPLKAHLDSVVSELNAAWAGMDKWMNEISFDSAKNDINKRIEYLRSEITKVGKVKNDILNGISRADSILKNR